MDFLFVEQLHFLLLIGLIWLVRTLTGHMINGLALLLYYGLISMSLRFGYQKIIKP
ncbi:MAG: hypothetical protein NVV59_01550 [Chitinophagaceae bacterium]|nr:hypothetical protein [Chitinophagaceae bacterium]